MKKRLLVLGAVSTIGLTSLAGIGLASAASQQNGSGGLIDKIATTFNLNRDEVQKVFDENRAEHEAERKAQLEEKLAQAVTDGKITQEQADGMKAKLEEMQTFRESLQDKTEAERREAMKTKMDELKTWMDENGIPETLRFLGGRGHGMGGPGHDGPPPEDAPAESTTTQ